ncbi:MAG TPA: DNA mismatch repair endonuclease MutL [Anaerolineae bacterium]
MPIQILPDTLVARIAAGEVVERPASVVKELVENAIDAGSRDIKIECAEGGRRLIRISDDGLGIRAGEVTLAFMHHATSKLRSMDDLSHIMTLGFRGEALASVASVSSVTCSTRHMDEPAGTLIRVDNGQIISQEPIGRTPGTTMTIEHLFARVPARLKFLKSNQTERGRIDAIVTRYALAYPAVRFTLVHDNRRAFQSLGNGNLRDVLIEVFGASAVEQMIPAGDFVFSNSDFGLPNRDSSAQPLPEPAQTEDDESQSLAENPKSKIENPQSSIVVRGYVAKPSMDHANRSKIILFVNGRPVQDAKLSYAVIQAYHTLLMTGRYPVAVIMVQVPSEDVDVNVHPAKAEVRFRDAEAVFSAIQRAVRRTLLDNLPVPQPPSVFVNKNLETGDSQPLISNLISPISNPQSPLSGSETWDRVGIARNAPPQSPVTSHESHIAPGDLQYPTSNSRPAQLPALRILGQLAASYIIAEGPEGLYLIDQHAAHERIMYERMLAARERGATASQALLDPAPVDVPAESAHLLEGSLTALHELGFEIDHFGGNTFLVRAVPAEMIQDDIAAALREIVADLEMGDAPLAKDIEARVARRVCKRMAIKAGRVLTYAEMAALVRDLEACDSPRTCPHGRPTMIQIGVPQLEREFGRLG